MSLPRSTEILVVGGGPTGLALAIALRKNGCQDMVVVDGAHLSENTSRAVIIHAATVEALDAIDCAESLVSESTKMARMAIWLDKGAPPHETATFNLLYKYTRFPFALSVPQHITEQIMSKVARERGIKVYRPHKVTNIAPNQDDNALTDVTFEDGHVLRARCVVGADGSRSTVRRLTNVSWSDPTAGGEANVFSSMIVADVTLSACPAGFRADTVNVVAANDSMLAFICLPGTPYPSITTEPVVRILCGIPLERGEPPHAPDAAYVQEAADRWGPKAVLPDSAPRMEIKQVVWSSRFRTHSSIVDTFLTHVPSERAREDSARGTGPVMLVGDAAHIHPPMGGQGMNLGIRDSVRLAPILVEYVRAAADSTSGPAAGNQAGLALEGPLRTWAAERRQQALTVIAMVKDLQKTLWVPNKREWFLGIIPYNPGWIRNTILRLLTSFAAFRRFTAWKVSGLGNP